MKRIVPLLTVILLVFSCSNFQKKVDANEALLALNAPRDDAKSKDLKPPIGAKGQIATFLTFQKEDAEQAMNFYIALFENSEIISVKRWGKDGPAKEGTIMHASFTLNGKLFMCSDSPPIHEWGFTPAVSNYVACESEGELEQLFTKLSENGKVLMPLNNYGFSQKFGFVEDQFGVSWQLNLD